MGLKSPFDSLGALKCIMKRFIDSLKISEFTRSCMENPSSVTGWQELFFSYKSF